MSKLFDRVVRLENRLDDRGRIQSAEMNIMRLEERVNALARHLSVKFETASIVVIERKNE